MLQITVPALEGWDESKQEFVNYKAQTLQLEHSLIAISKWESKWHKPFLVKEQKTREETLDYIKCMTITQNVDPEVYDRLTQQNIDEINAYIDNPMTATTFSDEQNGKPSREIITSELIDYWMIANNIPVEFRKWHLNRLITLIKICSVKNSPPKKQSKKEILSRNAALNAERRKRLNTKG
jgi:hypothetical protein